jgi:heme exporter protein A
MSLAIANLTVRRGERAVLDGISLRAEPGTAILLTGPNGAGKTTLLRAIAGLLAAAGGTIHLDAAAWRGAAAPSPSYEPDEVGPRTHLVGHLNAVKPALTVAENARFWCRFLGGADDAVPAALDRFRLAGLGNVRAAYLSAGQKRRLGLARLLLAPRPLWLLDEPAVSLDAASQELLAAVANEHLARGGLLLAATHQPIAVAPSREVRLAAGRLAA